VYKTAWLSYLKISKSPDLHSGGKSAVINMDVY